VIPHIEPVEGLLERQEYSAIGSVERIHRRMRSTGESFRAAYRAVATEIGTSAVSIAPDDLAYLDRLESEALALLAERLDNRNR